MAVSGKIEARLKSAAVSQRSLRNFAAGAQRAIRLRGDLHVLLASNAELQRLNRQFRRKNHATDVLSFPAAAAPAGNSAGDIAIAVSIAARQAREHGHTLADELKILLLHGMLHLAGYDHHSDNGAMGRSEEKLRRSLGLPSGLLARSRVIHDQRAVEKPARTKKLPWS